MIARILFDLHSGLSNRRIGHEERSVRNLKPPWTGEQRRFAPYLRSYPLSIYKGSYSVRGSALSMKRGATETTSRCKFDKGSSHLPRRRLLFHCPFSPGSSQLSDKRSFAQQHMSICYSTLSCYMNPVDLLSSRQFARANPSPTGLQ